MYRLRRFALRGIVALGALVSLTALLSQPAHARSWRIADFKDSPSAPDLDDVLVALLTDRADKTDETR